MYSFTPSISYTPTNKFLEIGSFAGGKTLDRYSNVPKQIGEA